MDFQKRPVLHAFDKQPGGNPEAGCVAAGMDVDYSLYQSVHKFTAGFTGAKFDGLDCSCRAGPRCSEVIEKGV